MLSRLFSFYHLFTRSMGSINRRCIFLHYLDEIYNHLKTKGAFRQRAAIRLDTAFCRLPGQYRDGLTCMHVAGILMHIIKRGGAMRTTLNIDDNLIDKAARMTGIKEKTALVRLGLEALIARESGKRLAKLGGTDDLGKLDKPIRKRSEATRQ